MGVEIAKDFSTGSNEEKSSPIYAKNKSKNSFDGSNVSSSDSVTLQDFKVLKFIAKGTFGSVFLAYLSSQDTYFAIKCIKKENLLEGDMVENARLEKLIMLEVEHPFIVKMHYVFQKSYRIYFVMDYINSGELFNHI